MAGTSLIICSCGKDIASYDDSFNFLTEIKKKKIIEKKYKNINPSVYNMVPDMTDYEDILNFLKFPNICCRLHKLTTASLSDLSHSFPIHR